MAHFLNTLPENLNLIEISQENEYLIVFFRFKRVDYKFIFNEQNEIINFDKKELL